MSRPARRLRVYVGGLAQSGPTLPKDAAHYLTRVHRLAVGDRFTAFDPELELECEATLTRTAGAQVWCGFDPPRPAARVGALPVTLLQVPGKRERLEEVTRAATALGVRSVHMLRSERSTFIPSDKHAERLRAIAIDAARQSGRGDLPRILGPNTLESVLECVQPGLRLCLDARAEVSLESRVRGGLPETEVALCVGPEGGFSDGELAALQAAGFERVALGPLTLRSELAAVAALGYFAARLPGVPDPL